ncbi:allantoate permease [Scheffersomyces coipomensis]|uniref:allantoate permease n=1 Tax=Scheffersomyces coipomensis TaxID=1788519 RepID=UPI00315C6FC0
MGIKEAFADEVEFAPVLTFSEEDLKDSQHVLTTIVSPHTGKQVNITSDVDEAMKYAIANANSNVHLDAARDKKLLRKIDLYLMPILCLLYCFQYMDKTTNSYAAILGLRTDLKMEGTMYAWTGSAFYIGYLFFEFFSARLLQRFPVAKTASVFIILWGIVLCLHSVPNYTGFVALRTILGMLESSVTVFNLIITGFFYKREEVFFRCALWFSSNGIGTIIGSGAIAYNVYTDQDNFSVPAWKLIFIITGCLTIFLGFIFLIHVPDVPTKAWFLNEEERILVVERIRQNQQGYGNKHFKWYQFREAVLDFKTWLIFMFALATNIPNGGITNFGSILLHEDFGFSTQKTLLMQMPGGAVEFVGCTLLAYFSGYIKSRMLWSCIGTGIAVAAECMLAFGSNKHIQYAGLTLYMICPIGFICLLSVISSNVAGHTKKVTVNAIFLIGYCVGNLIGPQTFLPQQAPNYPTAKICIVSFGSLSLVCLMLIWYSYWRENIKRDKLTSEAAEKFELIENHEFADLTDKENPLFRYAL